MSKFLTLEDCSLFFNSTLIFPSFKLFFNSTLWFSLHFKIVFLIQHCDFLLFKIECCDFPSYWTFNIVSQHQVHPSRGSSLEELCQENNTGYNIVFCTVLIGRLRNCPNLDNILLSNAIWWQRRICPTLLVTNEDLPNMYQSNGHAWKDLSSMIGRMKFARSYGGTTCSWQNAIHLQRCMYCQRCRATLLRL